MVGGLEQSGQRQGRFGEEPGRRGGMITLYCNRGVVGVVLDQDESRPTASSGRPQTDWVLASSSSISVRLVPLRDGLLEESQPVQDP